MVRRWYSTAFQGADKDRSKGAMTWQHSGRVATLTCTKEGPRLSIAPDAATSKALSG
jgi:hypothetical protein